MQKEYRDAIIRGIFVTMIVAVFSFIIRGQVSWTFVIIFSVVNPLAYLIGCRLFKKRKTEKLKEGPAEGVR